jgi:hypothetical protein
MRFRYALFAALVLALGIASLAIAATRDHHHGKGNENHGQFTASLSGDNEFPLTIHSNGTGSLTLTQTSSTSLSYTLTYSGLSSAASQAHVHFGEPGVAGGVAFWLCGGGGKPACPAGGGTVSGTVSASDILPIPAQGLAAGDFNGILQEIRNGATYTNVHTANFPGGEIRGQISSHGHGDHDEDND